MITKFSKRNAIGLFSVIGNIARISGLSSSLSSSLYSSFSSPSTTRRLIQTSRQIFERRKDFALSATTNLNLAEKEEEEEDNDEALDRWTTLYNQGTIERQRQTSRMDVSLEDRVKDNDAIGTPVRVVTFDLDNTLWKTSETISAANDALAIYLSKIYDADGNIIKVPKRIEKVMGDLFQADRRKYCPLNGRGTAKTTASKSKHNSSKNNNEGNGNDNDNDEIEDKDHIKLYCKSPVFLTQLRIDAICYVMETENGFSREEAMSVAETAFDEWTRARHDAILDHLAPRVVETLKKIRTTISYNNFPVLIGAITDGNSDPSRIEVLAPYFDFCVNAESVGISKPDRRVYLEAVRRAVKFSQSNVPSQPHMFSDLLPSSSTNKYDENDSNNNYGHFNIDDIDDETLEEMIGPYWCHIGDDFLKDMVAGKAMSMRTIFAVGLVQEKLLLDNKDTDNNLNTKNENQKMDMAKFLEKVSSQNIVTLEIGADDYLANSLHGEFVDAVAHDFEEISTILQGWHTKAIKSRECQSSALEVTEPYSNSDIAELSMTPLVTKNPEMEGEMQILLPRVFRIIREDCSIDIPAPVRNQEERTMKDVMGLAQQEKSSGVFAFDPDDVTSLKQEKLILMIQVGDTDLRFTREIFSRMCVQEVLSLTDENPVKLTLYMTEASEQPSFNLF